MIRLLIFVSFIFTLAFCLNLAPFFIENQKYEELVPIPLPWNNISYKRLLNINISINTNDSNGKFFIANGVEPNDFKIILSKSSDKFLLSLTTDTSCEIQASMDNSKTANFLIDFDQNIIKLNHAQKNCNISILDKKEDSLKIKVGGIQQGCIKINGIIVSNERIKLEASDQNYRKCLSPDKFYNDSEEKFVDPGVKVENRGHSHHHKTV